MVIQASNARLQSCYVGPPTHLKSNRRADIRHSSELVCFDCDHTAALVVETFDIYRFCPGRVVNRDSIF